MVIFNSGLSDHFCSNYGLLTRNILVIVIFIRFWTWIRKNLFVSFYWNVSYSTFKLRAPITSFNFKFRFSDRITVIWIATIGIEVIWMPPCIDVRSKNNRSINLNNRFAFSLVFFRIFDYNLKKFLENFKI